MKVYVVTVLIQNRIIDVSVFDSLEKATFFMHKWDLDDGVIELSVTDFNQFRKNSLIERLVIDAKRSIH